MDPPALLHGRRFSVRLYLVVLEAGWKAYLAREGLAKAADRAWDDNDDPSWDGETPSATLHTMVSAGDVVRRAVSES